MDPTDLSDAQLDQLAQRLAPHLPTGTHGDRVVLSRRAFAAAVGGTLGASGLVALGVDPAAAQAAGQVGTSSDPVDAFVFDLDVQNGATFNGTDISGVGSLSAEKLYTTPQVSYMGLSAPQTIANDTLSPVTWDTIVRNEANVADTANNAFEIPASPDFTNIRLTVSIALGSDAGGIYVRPLIDGTEVEDVAGDIVGDYDRSSEFINSPPPAKSGWIPISGGETITTEIRQISGGTIDLQPSRRTWFGIEVR